MRVYEAIVKGLESVGIDGAGGSGELALKPPPTAILQRSSDAFTPW